MFGMLWYGPQECAKLLLPYLQLGYRTALAASFYTIAAATPTLRLLAPPALLAAAPSCPGCDRPAGPGPGGSHLLPVRRHVAVRHAQGALHAGAGVMHGAHHRDHVLRVGRWGRARSRGSTGGLSDARGDMYGCTACRLRRHQPGSPTGRFSLGPFQRSRRPRRSPWPHVTVTP